MGSTDALMAIGLLVGFLGGVMAGITITFANDKVKLKTLGGSSKDSGGSDEDDSDDK